MGTSLLLVFVMAYFSALYPQVREKLSRDVTLLGPGDKRILRDDLATSRNLFTGVAILDSLILLLVSRSTWELIRCPSVYWPWSDKFVMAYGAFVLVSIYVTILLMVFIVNIWKIELRRRAAK